MKEQKISIPREKIREFCQSRDVIEFAVFGSAIRDDFSLQSDVDVLVTFAPDAQISLFDLVQMQIELEDIFDRPVDLVEKASLRNPYRRREILKTAQVVYAF
ncbi:MAG: nucleotidyltransferase family protein [Anaerolineaceae bacterium]|nr:nucleotidyltransferase family protein [Anaerolineaceae bacterium]